MKTLFLLSLASLTLSSCGQHASGSKATPNVYKNKIVLSAFNDSVSLSTLDESKLVGLPRTVDLSSDMSPVKNQDARGTCTFFSTMAMVEGAIKKDTKTEVNLSEEYLSHITKSLGYFSRNEGSDVGSNIAALDEKGVLLERDWSYQPSWFAQGLPCQGYKNTDYNAPLKCFSHNPPTQGVSKKIIRTYESIEFNALEKNTTNIIKFLAKEKRALTASVTVNFNGWPTTGDVFHNESLRKECLSQPETCGGHSVLLTGYDLDKRVFFFKNSWGKEWGHGGYGTITFDTIDRYTDENLYYARIVSPLPLPEDYDQDSFSFEQFSMAPAVLKQGSDLKVNIAAILKNTEGRTIYASTFLMRKPKADQAPVNDTNVSPLNMNDGSTDPIVRAAQYFLPSEVALPLWTEADPLSLSIAGEKLSSSVVRDLLSSKDDEAFLRTSVYIYTDDSTYKILKRVYSPLAQ